MANEYLVNSVDLTSVAESIRAKGGTSETLAFPAGFVEAVGAIETGGGSDDGSFKGVIERTASNPTLPSDLTIIGSNAFRNYTNLALTALPDGVTNIREYAFVGCTNLALTALPDGVTNISNYAFDGCTNLALTALPDGVTSIGNFSFRNCLGLTEITFKCEPSVVIKNNSFTGCTNLLTINVPWADGEVENAPWGATNATINYNYVAEGA